jgi:hypothetical protein
MLCSTQFLENFLAVFEVGVVQHSNNPDFFIGLLNPSENDFSTIESFSILAWRISVRYIRLPPSLRVFRE